MEQKLTYRHLALAIALTLFSTASSGQIKTAPEALSDLYTGKAYSPYAQCAFASPPHIR